MTTPIYVPDSSTLLILQDAINYALAACDDYQGMESAFMDDARYQGFRGRQRALRDAREAVLRAALVQSSRESKAAELTRLQDVGHWDLRTQDGVRKAAEAIVDGLLTWGADYHVDVYCAVYIEEGFVPAVVPKPATVMGEQSAARLGC